MIKQTGVFIKPTGYSRKMDPIVAAGIVSAGYKSQKDFAKYLIVL